MKKVILSTTLLFWALSLTACLSQGRTGPVGATGAVGPKGIQGDSGPSIRGASSGGGHAVKENSEPLLEYVKNLLVTKIKSSSAMLYKDLPNGWTREDIIEVIKKIEAQGEDMGARTDEALMFDYIYSPSSKKGKVVATDNYYLSYAKFPFREHERIAMRDQREIEFDEEQKKDLNSLMISMLHETAHLVLRHAEQSERKTDEQLDEEARQFAYKVLNAIDYDWVYCESENREETFEAYHYDSLSELILTGAPESEVDEWFQQEFNYQKLYSYVHLPGKSHVIFSKNEFDKMKKHGLKAISPDTISAKELNSQTCIYKPGCFGVIPAVSGKVKESSSTPGLYMAEFIKSPRSNTYGVDEFSWDIERSQIYSLEWLKNESGNIGSANVTSEMLIEIQISRLSEGEMGHLTNYEYTSERKFKMNCQPLSQPIDF